MSVKKTWTAQIQTPTVQLQHHYEANVAIGANYQVWVPLVVQESQGPREAKQWLTAKEARALAAQLMAAADIADLKNSEM